jgi:hypothetical protein
MLRTGPKIRFTAQMLKPITMNKLQRSTVFCISKVIARFRTLLSGEMKKPGDFSSFALCESMNQS